MKKIDSFKNENIWLSNFYPCRIISDGLVFSCVEIAFVAAKTKDMELKKSNSKNRERR